MKRVGEPIITVTCNNRFILIQNITCTERDGSGIEDFLLIRKSEYTCFIFERSVSSNDTKMSWLIIRYFVENICLLNKNG